MSQFVTTTSAFNTADPPVYALNTQVLKVHGCESGLKVPLQAKCQKPRHVILANAGIQKYEVHLKGLD